MSLNEILWSKLDLSGFGSFDNVEVFDTPQIVELGDEGNRLQYGVGICYRLNDRLDYAYIMHADRKNVEACGVVWNVYKKYHNVIDEIFGVSTALRNADPLDCSAFNTNV